MKKLLMYSGLILVTIMCYITLMAPASLALNLVEQDLKEHFPQLTIEGMEGTLWHSQFSVIQQAVPASRVQLEISRPALLSGHLEGNFRARGRHHDYTGLISVDMSGNWLISELRGRVDSDYFNQQLTRYGLVFSGNFELIDLSLTGHQKTVTDGSGKIDWSGGPVTYQTGDNYQTYQLPALSGELTQEEIGTRFFVNHQDALLLELMLNNEGWVKIAILGSLIRLARVEWPNDPNDDEIVMQFEEQMFQISHEKNGQ